MPSAKLQGLTLQRGFFPISETMLNEEYASIWDLLFDRHPKGAYYKGCFKASGTTLPAKSLLQDMFSEQRTALILDELQSWFDGLQDDPRDHGPKRRQWAFNFLQILSELAKDRPDLLCLLVSVRDSTTEAFRQVHRVGPMLIDFKGETAREDRKRLLLHRLFQNRDNFGDAEIEQAVAPDAASEQPSYPIVLDPNWNSAPWANVPLQTDVPAKWEERGDPVLIVLPVAPADPSAVLGPWLATHVTVNRNMIRFLLPKAGLPSIYDDRDLVLSARCAMVAQEFGEKERDYESLYKKKFYPEMKTKLAERFDRYATLEIWDFQDPAACTFHVEAHGGSGGAIPGAVEKHFRKNHFKPEDFTPFLIEAAKRGDTLGNVLSLLRGEPLPGQEAMPYYGVTKTYEDILDVAAKDRIALNVGGT